MSRDHKQTSVADSISTLADKVLHEVNKAVDDIAEMDSTTRIVALNAKIEAARAGEAGKAFSVVANEVERLTKKTAETAVMMRKKTAEPITELLKISKILKTDVLGTRLCDLAHTNIELIDRNLYERSCDCRWWATDDSLVKALTEKTSHSIAFASKRMGIILKSYTVYFDLVLADLDGTILANGRSETYANAGMSVADENWFTSAIRTKSGEEFGFGNAKADKLVNGKNTLVYSCAVRAHGDINGYPIGVLGVVFNWDALAQTIVEKTAIGEEDLSGTRVCIIDNNGLILADSKKRHLTETLSFENTSRNAIDTQKRGFIIDSSGNKKELVAFAHSPGFETYATGWTSVITQAL
jgi:hypothetical protein